MYIQSITHHLQQGMQKNMYKHLLNQTYSLNNNYLDQMGRIEIRLTKNRVNIATFVFNDNRDVI